MSDEPNTYLNRYVRDPEDVKDERLWVCPACYAAKRRHHAERERPFCPNCENRVAVLVEMEAYGPGAEKVDGGSDHD